MKKADNMIPIALKEVMRDRGLRQVEIVKKTGLSSSYISMVLNGQRIPEIYKLKDICSVLGLSLSAFFLKVSELEKGNSTDPDFSRAFEILAKIEQSSDDNDSGNDLDLVEAPEKLVPKELEVLTH